MMEKLTSRNSTKKLLRLFKQLSIVLTVARVILEIVRLITNWR